MASPQRPEVFVAPQEQDRQPAALPILGCLPKVSVEEELEEGCIEPFCRPWSSPEKRHAYPSSSTSSTSGGHALFGIRFSSAGWRAPRRFRKAASDSTLGGSEAWQSK